MNNLPVEILHLVFSLLVARDKLECKTVCRQWNQTIQNDSLFQVIYVHRQQQLDQLIKRVKEDLALGAKVDRLTIEIELEPNYNVDDLIDLFPNLHHFALYNLNNAFDEVPYFRQRQHHPWRETIQKTEELNSDINTRILLHSGLCKNLTSIIVSGFYQERVRDLIEPLSNAPALTTLHLHRYKISFQELELLHEKVPCLRSLWLHRIKSDSYFIPLSIKPATLVKEFRCISSFVETVNPTNTHVNYFSQKYTHLEELTLELVPTDAENDIDKVEEERKLVRSYINILAPRLKTLTILAGDLEYEDDHNAFDFAMLDECHCQIKTLSLDYEADASTFEMFSKSTQAQYVECLKIDTLMTSANVGSISDKWISGFKVLKELTLRFYYDSQFDVGSIENLNDFLEILSYTQLETLSLYGLRLRFDPERQARECLSLKKLKLSNITMQKNTDLFISKMLPNLNCLKLDIYDNNKDTYMFNYTNLSYLTITNIFIDTAVSILVISLVNNQERLYTKAKHDAILEPSLRGVKQDVFSSPSISSHPFDKSSSFPSLTIVCHSVRNFFMHDTAN